MALDRLLYYTPSLPPIDQGKRIPSRGGSYRDTTQHEKVLHANCLGIRNLPRQFPAITWEYVFYFPLIVAAAAVFIFGPADACAVHKVL